MRAGSLFSGIGAMDLGLQRAGMEIIWQVEVDGFCRRVLARHFPDAVRYGDVREAHGALAHAEGDGVERCVRPRKGRTQGGVPDRGCETCLPPVDLICGGFPCQPISHAGRRLGAADERWLWPEFLRIIREVQPRWVLVENVPGLLSIDDGRLFRGILWDLSQSGYDAEWDCLPAAAFSAPHIRDRVFIVAHAAAFGRGRRQDDQGPEAAERSGATAMGNTAHDGQPWSGRTRLRWPRPTDSDWWPVERHLDGTAHRPTCGLDGTAGWECGVPRTVRGQRNRVARLRGIGNAVVPAVAEHIVRLIMEADVALRCGDAPGEETRWRNQPCVARKPGAVKTAPRVILALSPTGIEDATFWGGRD